MRAVVVERPGDRSVLQVVDRPRPEPDAGEVRVRVRYSAANWGDVQKRQGIYPDPVRYPLVLGAEVSGVVDAMGRGVPARLAGRPVAALCGPRLLGGHAEYVTVPADYLVPIPEGLPLDHAAAFPVATLTAYHLLRTAHHLRRDEVVLVHAAAGAVGLAVTQIARLLGATVIGTVGSPAKRRLPLAMGAQAVIDRSTDDFVEAALEITAGAGVDLVIDSLGGEILPRSFDALRHFGRLINIGEASGEPDFPVRKKLYERSTSMAGYELLHAVPGSPRWKRGLRAVTSWIASGELTMPIGATYPMERIADLHAAFENRTAEGKQLLRIGADPGELDRAT
jgi:NADPH:quinone reductase